MVILLHVPGSSAVYSILHVNFLPVLESGLKKSVMLLNIRTLMPCLKAVGKSAQHNSKGMKRAEEGTGHHQADK